MMKRIKKNNNMNTRMISLGLIVLAVIFMSVGYAMINSITLDIEGNVSFESQTGIFITDVNYEEDVNADLEESKIIGFTGTVLNSKIVLSGSDGNSTISYRVKIYNKTNESYTFKGAVYDSEFYDNEKITFTISGLDVGGKIDANTSLDFLITFSYKDGVATATGNQLNSHIGFNFKVSQTQMETTLINNYVPTGNVEDIENIDLDTMTETERKEMFSSAATGKEIHTIKGINGDNVIILRGNYSDNYVSFGGYTWRILQIDDSGNLRIVLDGVISGTTVKYKDSATADTIDASKTMLIYTNSNVKTTLDNWYQNNLSSYSDKIVKSKFCANFTDYTRTSSGTQSSVHYFQSYENLGQDSDNYTPLLECPSEYVFEDNIGLISAEEVVLAGGAYNQSNTSFFLYNSSISGYYWTLSPAYYDPTQKNGNVFVVSNTGLLTDWTSGLLTNSYYIRPVITINGNLEMSGDGTSSNPYQFK